MADERNQLTNQALVKALTRPKNGDKYTVALVMLSPEDDHDTLNLLSYQKQRRINPSHVGMIAHAMATGRFTEPSQIIFAPDHEGNQVLVDGQHRLQAAIDADWTGPWVITCLWGKEHRADEAYIQVDTSQKERTAAVIGKSSTDFEALSVRMQSCMVAASRHQNNWDQEYEKPSICSIPPHHDCIDRANERMDAYLRADGILNDKRASSQIKRRMFSPMIMAVVIETLHTTPQEAEGFWQAVSTNGEGMAGHLRTLLLEGRPPRSGVHYMPRLTAQGWNQRASTRSMRRDQHNYIKVTRTNLVVPA